MPDSLDGTGGEGEFARDLFIGEAEEVFHFDHRAPVRILAGANWSSNSLIAAACSGDSACDHVGVVIRSQHAGPARRIMSIR